MGDVHPAVVIAAVIVGFLVVARLVRLLVWLALRLRAERSRQGKSSSWTVRLPRVGIDDPQLEVFRRDQRLRATTLLLSRMVNAVLAIAGVFIVLVLLEVDIAWFVGSAGFLGAGLAFGAQHSLHDFITGLHVLLEDRFFEGDRIEVGDGEADHRIVGKVERVGMFSTRLRHETTTMHIANRALTHVRNHSQRGHALTIDLPHDASFTQAELKQAVVASLEDVTGVHSADVVVDHVGGGGADRLVVDARVSRRLSTEQHERLAEQVAQRLANDPE